MWKSWSDDLMVRMLTPNNSCSYKMSSPLGVCRTTEQHVAPSPWLSHEPFKSRVFLTAWTKGKSEKLEASEWFYSYGMLWRWKDQMKRTWEESPKLRAISGWQTKKQGVQLHNAGTASYVNARRVLQMKV
jgi:hypothetical protein